MAIEHLKRIINMHPKRSLLELKDELGLTIPEGQDEVECLVTNVQQNTQIMNRLLNDYKYIFKPSSSHIYTYTLNPLINLEEMDLVDWDVVEKHQKGNNLYWLVEKESAGKRINTGWNYVNINVKQVGIIVLHTELNVLEIRSNAAVQKQLEKRLTGLFLELEPISIDRSYYTAVLEELDAKEFSIVWETEGNGVTKAQIDGANVSVKNAAAIHIKDENGELIVVDLGTEGTPESVWSTINGTDTKVLLSSKGNLRVSKMIKEEELNKLVVKVVSALNGLNVSQNAEINFSDVESLKETFFTFCEGTNKDVLKRFSKRYLAFRCLLSNDDTDRFIEYLTREGYIKEDYELVCENNHHIVTVEKMLEDDYNLECPICSISGIEYSMGNHKYKKVFGVTQAGFDILGNNDISVNDEPSIVIGMNAPFFNEEPIDVLELYKREERALEVKRQNLEEAIDLGDEERIQRILNEINAFKTPRAREIIDGVRR